MSKLDKRAISTLVIAIFLLSMITVLPMAYAPISIGPVSPTDIPVGPIYTTLTGPLVIEALAAEIGTGTIILTAPAGFEFDIASDVTATVSGLATQLTLGTGQVSQTVTPTISTITIDVFSVSVLQPSRITYTGIKVKATSTVSGIAGDLLFSGSVTDSAGTLTSVPDVSSKLIYTVKPATVLAGFETTVFTVQRQDQYNNPVTSGALVVDLDSTSTGVAEEFRATSGGTPVTAVTILAASSTADFYYYDEEKGTYTITASSGTLAQATTILDVQLPTAEFTIDVVSHDVVQYDDTVTVWGSGVTSGSVIELYWDTAFGDNAYLLNSTEGDPDGTFECDFDVPSDVVGDHYIWVKDVATGATKGHGPITMDPMIKLVPNSGLQYDKITIKGYGFSADTKVDAITWDVSDIVTLYPTIPDTDELGYWTATFKVPTTTSETVRAIDAKNEEASAYFTVGASISLSPSSGPVGTVVDISGRGFKTGEVVDGAVTFGAFDCLVIDGDTIEEDGEFRIKVVVPQVDEVGEFKITVTSGTDSPSADFEVDGLAEIETEHAFGIQGVTIGIEGWNFTRISGKEVQLELWKEIPPPALPGTYERVIENVETFETDSKGYFSGTFMIPARSSDKYLLKATQMTYNIYGETGFRIGLMLVLINPESGPTGTNVVVTGMGFSEGGEWNATFGDITIVDDGVIDSDSNLQGADGYIPTFVVPTLPPGTYTIVVNDITETDSIISVPKEFEVTETTTLVTDPPVAPNGYDVEVKGKYFSAVPVDVDFIIYNVTADGKVDKDWDLDVKSSPYPVITDKKGNFTCLWEVPDDEILSVGDYIINATDDKGLFAQYTFSVVAKTVEIEPRKPSFALGETVYFDIESSFAMDGSYIEIYDPYDHLYWRTDLFAADEWLKVGTIERMPYYQQTAGGNPMTLMDATVGPWFWEMFYEDDPVCNGTFEVTPAPSDILTDKITALSGELDELAEDIAGVTDEIAGDIADLSSDISDVEANVQDMIDDITADLAEELAGVASDTEAAVDELEGSIGDIAAAQNELDSKLDDMGQDTAAAKQAAEDAQRTSQGVTTLVYGAIAASLIAALAAIVSLMQISKKIA